MAGAGLSQVPRLLIKPAHIRKWFNNSATGHSASDAEISRRYGKEMTLEVKIVAMSNHRIGKYACLEVERRYLLRKLPAELIGRAPDARITDHYVPGTHLRLRRMDRFGAGVIWKLGQKLRTPEQGPLETTITNLYLDENEYRALCALGGNEIIKDRYIYLYEGRRYGIDVFRDELEGLILAEIECESKEEALLLPLPDFAVADVTNDPAFTGGRLATTGCAMLRQLLEKYYRS